MIKHIKCDIFESGADVICHQVNCQGVMGSGIAKQVREKYPEVYDAYMTLAPHGSHLLGNVLMVQVSDTQSVGNLFSQDNFGYDGKCYTNYPMLQNCLYNVKEICKENKTIAIPYKLGCCRGGGDWNVVYKIIEEVFEDYNGDILICEYNGG